MIVGIIITAVLCLASCEPSDGYYSGTLTVQPDPEQCRSLDAAEIINQCSHDGSTFFPSRVRDFDQIADALSEFGGWIVLLNGTAGHGDLSCQCIEVLKPFICFSYFPLCIETIYSVEPVVVYPCQELHEAFVTECKQEFLSKGYPWASWIENLDSNLLEPAATNTCVSIPPNTANQCPTTAPTRPTSCERNNDSNETEDGCDPNTTHPTIRPPVTTPPPSCTALENSFCSSCFGYNSTAPSLYRSDDLSSAAEYNREFNDFLQIIQANTPDLDPCFNYIKTFFCFTYFPYCENGSSIYPCSEVCEIVLGQNSHCRAAISRLFGHLPQWLESYDCAALMSISSSNASCAPGPDPPLPMATEPPTEPPCNCCTTAACQGQCDYRSAASGKTFQVNDFTFGRPLSLLVNCMFHYNSFQFPQLQEWSFCIS